MTTLSTNRRLLFALTIFASSAATASADDAVLKWKFKADDSFKLQFDQKNDIGMKVMGQETSNLSELKLSMSWMVKSVKDGVAEITQTIDKVEAHIQAQGTNIDFNSDDKKDSEDQGGKALSSIYRAALGVPYTLTVKESGEITKVSVPEKVSEALEKSPFKMMADSGSVFNEKGLKAMFAQIIPVLPVKTVKVGDELAPVKLEIPAGPLKMEMTYKSKVGSVEGKAIKVDSDIDTKINVPEDAMFSLKLTKQSGKRTFGFDTEAGKLTSSNLKQSFEMTVNANGMDIEQTISLDAVLTIN